MLTEKLDAEVAKSVLQAKKVQAKFAKANSEGTDKNNNNNGPGGTPVTVRTEANIIGPPPAVDKVEEEVTKKFKLMRPMSPYCSIQGTALSSQVEAKNQARQRRQAQLIEQYNQRMENLKNGKNESSQQTVWNSASVRARVDENKASSTSSITKAGLRLKVIYVSNLDHSPSPCLSEDPYESTILSFAGFTCHKNPRKDLWLPRTPSPAEYEPSYSEP